ncbi:hypothetical protein GQ53DRAFT_743754 [Thozetella sp. PMI_491]|nr:hypothetical protein GQ53DRAFT_743754 [Thozetella sp. PMI_491]
MPVVDGLPRLPTSVHRLRSPTNSSPRLGPATERDNGPVSLVCSPDGDDQSREGSLPPDRDSDVQSCLSNVDLQEQEDLKPSLPGSNASKCSSEPYAKLIYRAFIEHPRHAMCLQEIYQWFRDNTDKPKAGGKGWMNSIRHNLSMNKAFSKRERGGKDGDPVRDIAAATASTDKKDSEWYLEKWALDQGYAHSTTRYRKDCPSRRSYRGTIAPAKGARGCRAKRKRYHGPGPQPGSRNTGSVKDGHKDSTAPTSCVAAPTSCIAAPTSSVASQPYHSPPTYNHDTLSFVRQRHAEHGPPPPSQYDPGILNFNNYKYPNPQSLASGSPFGFEAGTYSALPRREIKSEPLVDEPATPEAADFSAILPVLHAEGLVGRAEQGGYYGGSGSGSDHAFDIAQYRLQDVAGVYDEDPVLPQYDWEGKREARPCPRYPQ